MSHKCHWPTCDLEVPPKMWGCRGHWFTLPGNLRSLIWRTYREGQEVDKKPSIDYLEAAKQVQDWISLRIKSRGDVKGKL
jgi:hypothetical protein